MTRSTRDRILDAAMQLFAEGGYVGTTVGDIEKAAGLAPRRGGLYRHFSSKEEVFRVAVVRYAEKFGPLEGVLEAFDFSDAEGTLTAAAVITLTGLTAEADLFRLMQRDGPDFPDLSRHVHQQLIERGYEFATELFRRLLADRGLPADDARSMAAVALASLVHFREDEAIYGIAPGDVGEEEFVRTWVDTWTRVLDARSQNAG